VTDLVDYLRDKLVHADDVVCSCPDIDVSTWADQARGERPTVKGYEPTCPVHGIDGSEPIYRRGTP